MGVNVTIKDVAKRAGVSIATVSFVLNKHPNQTISEKVRDRVLAAARHLDYHARASAVGLAGRRTHNVAVMFYQDPAGMSNQFRAPVIEGALKETMQRDYNLLFAYQNSDYEGYQDLPKFIRERNAEGVLFVHKISPRLIRDLHARGVPVVTIDSEPAMRQVESLNFDARHGAMLATEHLIQLGHRHMGFLVANYQQPSIKERGKGFRAAYEKYGLPFDEKRHFHHCPDFSYDAAYVRTKELLKEDKAITGLVCANDVLASGAIRAAHELGRKVPRGLSVVGFDDIEMSAYLDPPLTTVRVDKEQLGRRGIARLLELVDANDGSTKVENWTFGRETLPVDLVIRDSTASPR